MTEERSIGFTGRGLELLVWGLFYIMMSVLILPAAIGAVALYRWFVEKLTFSDGTGASFEGQAKEIWGYFALAALLGMMSQLSNALENPFVALAVALGLPIFLLPIRVAVELKILRWFFANIRLSCGTTLRFKGDYESYLGWSILVALSIFTIIGWAWASVAMLRWICRNIEGGSNKLEFQGGGLGLLWRGILGVMACVFIITIPWVVLWLGRWVLENMVIKQEIAE